MTATPKTDAELKSEWLGIEAAGFTGWDFTEAQSHTHEEEPPWSYPALAGELVARASSLLDIGTGGGEALAKLAPLPAYCSATEDYPPNVRLALENLQPLGVTVVEASQGLDALLPYEGDTFDVVLARHTAFSASEVHRVLKPGGVLLTQQVPSDNMADLAEAMGHIGEGSYTLDLQESLLTRAFGAVESADRWTGHITFSGVDAIVFNLTAIPWTVPRFSVETHFRHLLQLHREHEVGRELRFTVSRMLFRCRKV